MPVVTIRGLDVPFPFDPYPAQVEYMSAVIDALENGCNALLESPTGTGKTLCLLCATLAWTMHKQRGPVRRHPRLDPATGCIDANNTGAFKIVYCSRTHAQLTQVIRELKRVLRESGTVAAVPETGPQGGGGAAQPPWADLAVALLGSRDHMCVNSEVSRLPSSQAQQSVCNALRADKSCRFFMGLHINKSEGCLPMNSAGDTVYDMEDLVAEGRKVGFCPYYLERDLSKLADIVFMPYNYILDSQLRKQLPFELNKNCILIVDEAHNLPSVLSASGCLNLTPLELANAIQDCSRAVALQRIKAERPEADAQLEALRAEEFASLKILMARVEACLAAEGDAGPEEGTEAPTCATAARPSAVVMPGEVVRPGAYMEEFLAKTLITRDVFDGAARSTGMNETISNAIATLMESEKPASGLPRVQQFLAAVFGSPMDDSTRFVVKDQAPAAGPSSRPGHQRSLGFWRLDNSADLTELSNQLRAMLLTSGTLSPLDHFAAELGAAFPVRLRGAHVIGGNQVLCSVLRRGPTGDRLNGSYAFRSSVEYRTALGMSLVNISRVTPGGTLVFFPSYAALNATVELWRAGTGAGGDAKTIWGLLTQQKPVLVEPTGSGDLVPIVAEYQRAIRDAPRKGAILLAVCRGKVSEGIDFADNDGRCVMVTGIPFANHTDLFVRLKREYLTQVAPRRPRVDGKLFTGDSWYRHEAMRAVNQAVGRVIRHKDDYGAIVLADERFADQTDSLSDWMRGQTSVHNDFRDSYAALAKFFTERFGADATRHGARSGAGAAVGLGAKSPAEGRAAAAAIRGTPAAVPDTATLAKQYALKRERDAGEEARRRVQDRFEEVSEPPTAVAASSLAKTEGAHPHAESFTDTLSGTSATLGIPAVPQMRKQTLSELLARRPAARSGTPPGVGDAAALVIGSTSREFCAFLKEHTAAPTYDRFRTALRDIARMRATLHATSPANDPAELRERFGTVVNTVRGVFAEAASTHVDQLLLEFGRHIPEEFRPVYAHTVRKLAAPL